jgi:hypothetical protein
LDRRFVADGDDGARRQDDDRQSGKKGNPSAH